MSEAPLGPIEPSSSDMVRLRAPGVDPGGPEDLVELLETLPDAVYRVDADGFVRYVNREAERLLEYDLETLRGMRFHDVVRPDFREQVTEFFARQIEERRPYSYLEYPLVSRSGQELWVGQTTRLVEQEGDIVGGQGVVRYIGRRKRREGGHRDAALRDLETGLLSPMAFRLMVEQQAARSTRIDSSFSVLVLTLRPPSRELAEDGLPETLGRLVPVLRTEVRGSDAVCRSAARKLTLLLPDTGTEEAETFLARIRPVLLEASASWTFDTRIETWNPEDPVPVEAFLETPPAERVDGAARGDREDRE